MPMIDLMPMDTTYISCDHPDADHSRAGALFAATDRRRGMTEMILLKYPRPSLPTGAAVERAELVLYPWRNRGAQESPAFCVYGLKSDFVGSRTTWERRPRLADFPKASQPTPPRDKDGAIPCDITGLVERWLAGGEDPFGIAVMADAGSCLMIHSGCSEHPPKLRLLCLGNELPKAHYEEGSRHKKELATNCPESEEGDTRRLLCGYQERACTLDIDVGTAYTAEIDISTARTVTFLIKNCSCAAIEAALQLSPNGLDWMDDKQRVAVPPDGLAAITPYLFARYIRVGISSADPKPTGKARVWYQAQSLNYRIQ